MDWNNDNRRALRPQIIVAESNTPMETFMHKSLRPILKLQNEHLLMITRHFLTKRKVHLAAKSPQQRLQQIQHSIGKDNRLRGLLFGCVIGQFTEEEIQFYLTEEAEVNRRITQLLVQRLQTQTDRLLEG